MSDAKNSLVFGLERDCFLGQSVFDIETERVFSKSWISVGRKEDFGENGDEVYRTFQIGGYSVIVVIKSDGSVDAFHNVCRHRGTRLIDQEQGVISNSCISCPYHAWTYALDGCLIGAPNMSDMAGFQRQNYGLMRVGCVIWNGFVLLNLAKSCEDFANDFQPIIERLANWSLETKVLAQTLLYEVAANWKLLFQNYSECYHCPTVHPNLNRMTPYKTATNDLMEGPILGGPMRLSDGIETVSVDGKHVGEVFDGLNEQQRRSVYYYTLFPNMFVSAHPDYVMFHQIERISNEQSKVSCHFLTMPETDSKDMARAVEQWDEVNRQDWRVCELTQKGISSPAYSPGPYSSLETMLMAFDRHYRNTMALPEK